MADNHHQKETSNPSTPKTIKPYPNIESLAQSTAQTAERAYYHQGNFFIKRSLRPSEYITTLRGTKHIPPLGKERLQNEATALHFIRSVSDIPVPTLYGAFEVDESFFLIMEYIDGVCMSQLSDDRKEVVFAEVEKFLSALRRIKSKSRTVGGPSGIVIPPYRVMELSDRTGWPGKVLSKDEDEDEDFVFCHNDLSQHNIIVDPETLRIRAIIDWEYSGFFPRRFEYPFYKRPGPSVALDGEYDDSVELLRFMEACK